MNGIKWVLCCAVVGVSVVILSLAEAQELASGAADERSVLIAEQQSEVAAAARDLCECVGESDLPIVTKIGQALRSPLRQQGLDFVDTPLEEVVNVLQEDYGIPIQLDLPALEEIGLGPDEQVTVNVHNISLRSALRLMLHKLQLTYVIDNEVLIITTPEEQEALLLTCVYDVRDLIDDASEKSSKALVDTIVSCIETDTWAKNGGGDAEIRMLKPRLLVISQTQAVHEEIRGLLAAIRHMRGEAAAPTEADAAAGARDADKVVTRFYALQVGASDDADKLRAQIRDLIVQSVPDERWTGRLDDGQAVVLTVLPDRVVLRHMPSVQNKVQALLIDSGVAMATTAGAEGMPGSGFGGGIGGGGGGFFQPDPAMND